MIRAFPKGFNYPIPCGWLIRPYPKAPPAAYPWNEFEVLQEKYRGFRVATRLLAKEPNHLPTGINCTIFDEPCEEYYNFTTVRRHPGFRRLDLALLIGGEDEKELDLCWRSLLNGRLRRALGEAASFRTISLPSDTVRWHLISLCIARQHPLRLVELSETPRQRWTLVWLARGDAQKDTWEYSVAGPRCGLAANGYDWTVGDHWSSWTWSLA